MAETTATQDVAALAREEATRRKLVNLGPSINGMKAALEAKQVEKELPTAAPTQEMEAEYKGLPADPKDWSMKELLESKPVPEDIDPFSRTLIGGCDPVASHQVMTLIVPIIAFLGHNARALYGDSLLRWICGQSWQMGGSGRGKSVVLRELESLFLSKEMSETKAAVREVAKYAMLSEKERKEKPQPPNKVFIYKNFPTSIALLEQMQKNGGGAIYFSCTECGELAKKVSQTSYSTLLDMMKQSYDGIGEDYMHQNKEIMLYAQSMKICCNIGGTDDPIYKVFSYCNADGTLSRGNLTILPQRKNEKVDGKYKSPSWTTKERSFLRECADRLRMFSNNFHENKNVEEIDECGALLDKYGLKANDTFVPTVQDLEDCIQIERCRRAVCIPEVLELGGDIKDYLFSLGDVAANCCSRADERAMGICYLLLIANGYGPLRSDGGAEAHSLEARTPEDYQLLRQCINVSRWMMMICIDCAMAVQTVLDSNTKSMKESLQSALDDTVKKHVSSEVQAVRELAFSELEARHAGEEITIKDVMACDIFAKLHLSTVYRLINDRGWKASKKGFYLMPEKTGDAAS